MGASQHELHQRPVAMSSHAKLVLHVSPGPSRIGWNKRSSFALSRHPFVVLAGGALMPGILPPSLLNGSIWTAGAAAIGGLSHPSSLLGVWVAFSSISALVLLMLRGAGKR